MNDSYKYAKDLLKQFGWNSIILKYWEKMVLFFLIPFFLLNIIIYMLYTYLLKQEVSSSFQLSCSQTLHQIESSFDRMDSIYYQFVSKDTTSLYLTYPLESIHNGYDTKNIRRLRETLNDTVLSSGFLDSIYLYSFHHNYVISQKSGHDVESFSDRQWYDYALTADEFNFVLVREKNAAHPAGIYVSYAINSRNTTDGLLVFSISNKYIDTLISNALKKDLLSMYILDRNNTILYSSCHTTGDVFDDSSQDHLISLRYPIRSDTLTLVFYQNPDYLHQKTYPLNTGFLVCICLAILFPLLMTLYISMQFYLSIHKIISSLASDAVEEHTNEIEFITYNIITLTQHSKQFEKELADKIQLLKQHQALALQFQFNPHFLFNTLNMIHVMCAAYTKGPNDVNKMIMLLSELLTLSMDTNDYIIPLFKEVEYEKKYLEILRLQHKRVFHVTWNIAEDTLQCTVLKLLLQPIIENTFQHGLKHMSKSETFVIDIRSQIINDELFITVYNSGKGVSQEKLQELRNQLDNNDMFVSRHIGLNNVHQRIRLLFGDNYGCRLDSDDHGFTVTLHMPAKISLSQSVHD